MCRNFDNRLTWNRYETFSRHMRGRDFDDVLERRWTLLKFCPQLILIKDLNCWFSLGEDRDLKEFGKFKPFRSVPHYNTMKPEYAVDGSIGESGIFGVIIIFQIHHCVLCDMGHLSIIISNILVHYNQNTFTDLELLIFTIFDPLRSF